MLLDMTFDLRTTPKTASRGREAQRNQELLLLSGLKGGFRTIILAKVSYACLAVKVILPNQGTDTPAFVPWGIYNFTNSLASAFQPENLPPAALHRSLSLPIPPLEFLA